MERATVEVFTALSGELRRPKRQRDLFATVRRVYAVRN